MQQVRKLKGALLNVTRELGRESSAKCNKTGG